MCINRRDVFTALKKYGYLIVPVIGSLCSFLVFMEMIEKLFFPSKANWSPLRLLGPATWLPLTTDTGKLFAVQTMIHSIMYIVACYNLARGLSQRADRLIAPWYMLHNVFITYQLTVIVVFEEDYQPSDNVLGTINAVTNFVLILFGVVILLVWKVQERMND